MYIRYNAKEPLCGHCNSIKGDRPQEYLVARLKELGTVIT